MGAVLKFLGLGFMALSIAGQSMSLPPIAVQPGLPESAQARSVAAEVSTDFRYDILPLLHRQGCATAYCHGSATGQGGFKLSLFGSNPAADHRSITRDLGGRRVDFLAPSESLLLQKPTLALDHGGGRKLRPSSSAYLAIRAWIEAGAPYQGGPKRELRSLKLNRKADRLTVIASYETGAGLSTEDVTSRSIFTSSDALTVEVDRLGRMSREAPGSAWVFARFSGRSASLRVTEAFGVVPSIAAEHELDKLWLLDLSELGLARGPRAATEVIARRLYLDLVDRLPSRAEQKAFSELPLPRRVGQTADRLMKTPGFAVKWGRVMAQWFEIPTAPPERPNNRTAMYKAVHQDLVAAIADADSMSTIVRRILIDDRRLIERFEDPRDRAEWTGRTMLGVKIGCARCHDSPIDRWRQSEHLAFSALFASLRPSSEGGTKAGVFFNPETGKVVAAAVLPDVTKTPLPASLSHAETVARFVLDDSHDLFRRSFANRVFASLLGKGLVTPLDDHRLSNPAQSEAMLGHLAEEAKHDQLRQLIRHIVTSRFYQTDTESASARETKYLARREARQMTPATYEYCVQQVLGVERPIRLPRSPLALHLAVFHSQALHGAIDRSPLVESIILFGLTPRSRLDDVFVALLSRSPRPGEVAAFLPLIQENQAEGLKDLVFALLASREFGSIR